MIPPHSLKECEVCGGTLASHNQCTHCGAVRRGERWLTERLWKCSACGRSNPLQFVCGNCGTRFLHEEVVIEEQAGKPPQELDGSPIGDKEPSKRKKRRFKGYYDQTDIAKLAAIPGMGKGKAEALCKAGFNSVWKVKRTTLEDLSLVPGVGLEGARAIKGVTNRILIMPIRRSKEEIFAEERECFKCGLPTSVFSKTCLECGSEFEDEEIDEAMLEELRSEGNVAVIEFYGFAVTRRTNDALLWYALALSLGEVKKPGAAMKALDRARTIEPANERFSSFARRLEDEAVREIEARRETRLKAIEPPAVPVEAPPQKPRAEESGQAVVQPVPETKVQIGEEEIGKLDQLKLIAEAQAEIDEALGEEPEEPASESTEATPPEPSAPPPKQSEAVPEEPEPPRPLFEEAEKPEQGAVNIEPRARAIKVEFRESRRPLLAGHGLVNGRGRVNGLINGNGFINGGSISSVSLPRSSLTQRYIGIAAVLLFVFLIFNAVFQPQIGHRALIQIDGDLGDWAGIGSYTETTSVVNKDVNLTRYSMQTDGESIFVMAQVQGILFNDTQGYDALYVLLDTDSDNSTGYWCGAIGADYLVTIEGTNRSITSSVLSSFGGGDNTDWNSWVSDGGVDSASSGRGIEGAISLRSLAMSDPSGLLARFVMDDETGNVSESSIVIGSDYGALKVVQRSLTSVLSAGQRDFLELTFELTGPPLTMTTSDLIISHTPGTSILGVPSSISLSHGVPYTLTLAIDASAVPTGDVVTAALTSVNADRPVTIIGSGGRAYSVSPPQSKRIDGLFADWPTPHVDTDAIPVRDRSLDVTAFDGNATGTIAFFYFRTVGPALGGTIAPVSRVKASSTGGGGGGTPGPVPRRSGEDRARAYLDSDPATPGGCPVADINAKYMIEARGAHGSVLSVMTYSWQGSWVLFSGTPRFAKDDKEVEMSITLPAIDSQNATYVIETANWRGRGDVTVVAGTRGSESTRTRGLDIVISGSSTLMVALYTESTPNIDGHVTAGEWDDADSFDTGSMIIHTMQDGTYLYLCVQVKADLTYNQGDSGEVAFDTDDDGDTAPDSVDKKFSASDPDGSAVPEDFNGNGNDWDPGYTSPYTWSANGDLDIAGGGSITYEFQIAFHEVWNTDSPGEGDRAGMAVHAHDAEGSGADYYWGSSNMNDPSTFGHLDIPEFQDGVFVLLLSPAIVILMRRSGKVNKRR